MSVNLIIRKFSNALKKVLHIGTMFGIYCVLIVLFFYVAIRTRILPRRSVLYVGQAYYNAWYLSRALRRIGWCADVLNWDSSPGSEIYYHGEDFRFNYDEKTRSIGMQIKFYLRALLAYDIFHFSNTQGIVFGFPLHYWFKRRYGEHFEIYLLKWLGKKIVYSNNGCQDGVSQTAFSQWGPESICAICRWRDEPTVCSDDRNLAWGAFRNSVADYQCLLGGNRVDFNEDPTVHEVPEFYCLDQCLWHPEIEIPFAYKLELDEGELVLYHAVGNRVERTDRAGVNIKSSHVYLPLVKKLRDEGLRLRLIEPVGIPNRDVRYLQAQADVFLEMLTYGWFGANAREAMMLGKPVICYIRPEWLDSVRKEIPEYADELPIVSATPHTVEAVLRRLIADPEERHVIGMRSRAFAIKWHSAEAGGRRFDDIYGRLLNGDKLLLLRKPNAS